MSVAQQIIEELFESGPAIAPTPTKPHQPKPGKTPPRHNPWRRRDIKPGEAPRPKASGPMENEALAEAKKKKAKGQVAASPGKVGYGKARKHESLARRLLDSE